VEQTRLDEPAEYAARRDELLQAEIALMRQREAVAALRRALPPGASRRAAGRKESSLQGVEIAHFVEGKGNPGAAFPVVLARVLGTKGAFRRQKEALFSRSGNRKGTRSR